MKNIINISEAASIALHATALMASRKNQTMTNKEIAEELCVSEAHLAKVLQRLNKAGLVESTRGPKGGFQLARPPGEISLLNIYEAIEGPVTVNTCIQREKVCLGKGCILGELLHHLGAGFREYLSKTRLSDLEGLFKQEKEKKGEEESWVSSAR